MWLYLAFSSFAFRIREKKRKKKNLIPIYKSYQYFLLLYFFIPTYKDY